jgi:sRNA-binding carbon storage regulator CsrA
MIRQSPTENLTGLVLGRKAGERINVFVRGEHPKKVVAIKLLDAKVSNQTAFLSVNGQPLILSANATRYSYLDRDNDFHPDENCVGPIGLYLSEVTGDSAKVGINAPWDGYIIRRSEVLSSKVEVATA